MRILAAASSDVEHALRAGALLPELYDRLNLFTIVVPPLREHKEDLPVLVAHRLEALGRELGKTIGGSSRPSCRC